MSDTINILSLVLEILSKNEAEAEKNLEEGNISEKNIVSEESLDRPKQPPWRQGAPQAVTQTSLRYRGVIIR